MQAIIITPGCSGWKEFDLRIKQFQAVRPTTQSSAPAAIAEPDSKQNTEAGPAMKISSPIHY